MWTEGALENWTFDSPRIESGIFKFDSPAAAAAFDISPAFMVIENYWY
jgi:hypothetical protein